MNTVIGGAQIRAAAKGKVNEANMTAVVIALDQYGWQFGLDKPHRVVQFLAQIMHESGDFRYDREVWGPTEAQKRYDTRTDLGNTKQADGDGKLYMGRTGIQVTGKANYAAFRDWCKEKGLNPPDFVKSPDLINTDPWEGLAPIWYWDTRNLNRLADQGDIETITKRINGGMNGFDDRVDHFARLALVVIGLAPGALKQFQASKGLVPDGDPGPKTRAALHQALVALVPGESRKEAVKAAPVTEEVKVVPVSVDKQVKKQTNNASWFFGGLGSVSTAMTGLLGGNWQTICAIGVLAIVALIVVLVLRRQLVAAVKEIRGEVEQ